MTDGPNLGSKSREQQLTPLARQTDYSGKLNLRMSSSLHAHLVAGAAREGVSLNAWIISLLAGASGFKNTEEE